MCSIYGFSCCYRYIMWAAKFWVWNYCCSCGAISWLASWVAVAQGSLFYLCQLDQYMISKCLASYFWKAKCAIDQEAAVTGHFALREAAFFYFLHWWCNAPMVPGIPDVGERRKICHLNLPRRVGTSGLSQPTWIAYIFSFVVLKCLWKFFVNFRYPYLPVTNRAQQGDMGCL